MCSALPEPVEGGMAAVPCLPLPLCVSNLWAIRQNPLVLSVTVICVCVYICKIFTLSFKMPNRLHRHVCCFFSNAEGTVGQSDDKKIGISFPSCICATEVAVSHL